MVSIPQLRDVPKVIFRKITQGPRLNLPKKYIEALGWTVGDQVSLEPLEVKGALKLVVTNESQKYRKPLKERLKEDK